MRITKVRQTNIKGQNRVLPISPRTLLTGRNGSGKTSILETVAFAVLGMVPRYGKKGTPGLASGSIMSGGITCTDGEREILIDRTLQIGDSVKESLALQPPVKGGLKACQDRVRELLGECNTMVDLSEILDLTPAKRAELIGKLLGASGESVSVDDVIKRLWARLSDLDFQHDPNHEAELGRDMRNTWDRNLGEAENLDRIVGMLTAKVSEAAGEEKQATAAFTRLTSSATQQDSDPRSVPQLKEERSATQKGLDALRAELTKDEQADESRRITSDRREEATALREEAEAKKGEHQAEVEKRTKTATELAQTKAKLEARELPERISTQCPPELDQAWRDATQRQSDALSDQRQAEANASAAQKGLEAFKNNQACPVALGLSCPVGGDILATITEQAGDLELIAQQAGRKAKVAIDATAAAKKAMQDEVNRLAVLNKEASDAHFAHTRAVGEIQERININSQYLNIAKGNLESCEKQLKRAADLEREARRAENETTAPIDRETVEKQIAQKVKAIWSLDDALTAKERARSLVNEQIEAERESNRKRIRASFLRALQAAAKSEMADVLAKGFGPLTDTVSGLLARVSDGWAIEVRPEANGINLYAQTDPAKPSIPWRALSGGEGAVFGAALALALVRLQNPPSKFLLLEAAEVDAENLPLLMTALSEMGDDFDSIIVATCHNLPDGVEVDGWEVLTLGRAAASLAS